MLSKESVSKHVTAQLFKWGVNQGKGRHSIKSSKTLVTTFSNRFPSSKTNSCKDSPIMHEFLNTSETETFRGCRPSSPFRVHAGQTCVCTYVFGSPRRQLFCPSPRVCTMVKHCSLALCMLSAGVGQEVPCLSSMPLVHGFHIFVSWFSVLSSAFSP